MTKDLFQEVNDAQLKIGSLFRELLDEREALKLKSEEMSKSLKLIKEGNKVLLEQNEELKKIVATCFKPFLALQVFDKQQKKPQEFLEYIYKFYSDLWVEVEGLLQVDHTHFPKCQHAEDVFKKSHISKNGQGFGLLSCSNQPVSHLGSGFSEDLEKTQNEDKSWTNENTGILKEESFNSEIINNGTEKSPTGNQSPVFKDLKNKAEGEYHKRLIRPGGGRFSGEKRSATESPLKRFFIPNNSSPNKETITPKRSRVNLALSSPKASSPQLTRSNSKEAQISGNVARKLTQTFLNVDCFKKLHSEQDCIKKNNVLSCKVEGKDLDDEDDVIMDSPAKKQEEPEDWEKKSEGRESCSPTRGIDLDETYVNLSLVRRCKLTGKQVLEKIMEDQTPLRRPAPQKSPEYDSVHFVYKREPARKKADRLKLPGHPCVECNKYYKEAWGDELDTEKIQQKLNKCSRHRDKFSPTRDDTPDGYWKPYLTATVTSPTKGSAFTE